MSKPLSREEVQARVASAPTADERRRWQVIAYVMDHTPITTIVAATGFRPRTIMHILKRYHEIGPDALVDRRKQSRGAAPLLSTEVQDELVALLQQPAPNGDTWTGPDVASWIAARIGRRVHRQRGWEYLKRLGNTTEPPDAIPPSHEDAE